MCGSQFACQPALFITFSFGCRAATFLARKLVDWRVMQLYHSARLSVRLPFFIRLLAMFGLFCPERPLACIDLCLTVVSIFSLLHGNNQFFFHLHGNSHLTATSFFFRLTTIINFSSACTSICASRRYFLWPCSHASWRYFIRPCGRASRQYRFFFASKQWSIFSSPHGNSSAPQFSLLHGNLTHGVSYLSSLSRHLNKYSISLMAEHIFLAPQPCLSGILIPIWPHCRASPGNIIIDLASAPCPSRQYHHLFGLTAAPLQQYQMGQSLSSAAPSVFLASCFDALSPWIIAASPREPLGKQTCTAQTPILYLCCPSLDYWGKNRTALGPIFFSFHTHFALLSQHSWQIFRWVCNVSRLPILGKMLPCFALISGTHGCFFYPCWCCFSYNAGWQTAFASFLMLTHQDEGPCIGLGRSNYKFRWYLVLGGMPLELVYYGYPQLAYWASSFKVFFWSEVSHSCHGPIPGQHS